MTMELLLAVPVSVISAALVFYLTRMSGSFAFFWVAYLVTIYVGIGASLYEAMLLCAHTTAAHACILCMHACCDSTSWNIQKMHACCDAWAM